MTNLKSILLGTGAAIVAATTAQAADLPVVEPVDYVQICDLYGDGFFYIPGTNTCLELSGFARFEARFNGDEAPSDDYNGAPFALAVPNQTVVVNPVTGLPVVLEADGDNFAFGARGRLNIDARTETELGTLRSFIQFDAGTSFGVSSLDDVDIDLAFIQFEVGPTIMTAGLAASISGVSGPDTLGDATAFESGLGETIQLAFAFDFGPVSAAIAISDPQTTVGTQVFDGFVVAPGVLAANPTNFVNFTSQNGLSKDLPYLEAAFDFDLGPVSIDTGFALGQVEGRVQAFDATTGVLLSRDFDEVGYGAAISGQVDIAALRVKAGASYAKGIADFGQDGFTADYRIGTPFGAPVALTSAGALAQLDMELVEAYSFYGQIGANVGAVSVNLIGTYGQIEYPTFQNASVINGGDKAEAYTVALNASVTPVDGLRITGEVYYSDVEVDRNLNTAAPQFSNADGSYDDDQFGAIFRIERSF